MCLVREYLGRRFGDLKVQEKNFVHAGMELTQDDDLSVKLTQEKFMDALNPTPITPSLRASHQRPLSMDEIRMRERKLGELRLLAAVSRPDICVCLA